MNIFFTIDFETHRPPSVRAFVGTGSRIFTHIQFGAFEVITHKIHDFQYIHFPVRFNPQGHPVCRIAFTVTFDFPFGIVPVLSHIGIYSIEERPYPDFTGTGTTEIYRSISIGKTEIGIFPVLGIKAFLFGKRNHIFCIYRCNFFIIDFFHLVG